MDYRVLSMHAIRPEFTRSFSCRICTARTDGIENRFRVAMAQTRKNRLAAAHLRPKACRKRKIQSSSDTRELRRDWRCGSGTPLTVRRTRLPQEFPGVSRGDDLDGRVFAVLFGRSDLGGFCDVGQIRRRGVKIVGCVGQAIGAG